GGAVDPLRERPAGYPWWWDLLAMLSWAVLVGALGAFAATACREAMRLVQGLATGRSGSIVGVTRELPWYGRLLFPTLGGVAAGVLLWASSRLKGIANSDYMVSDSIGDGRLSI